MYASLCRRRRNKSSHSRAAWIIESAFDVCIRARLRINIYHFRYKTENLHSIVKYRCIFDTIPERYLEFSTQFSKHISKSFCPNKWHPSEWWLRRYTCIFDECGEILQKCLKFDAKLLYVILYTKPTQKHMYI